ncbi:MAG: response regulator transcription factor [Candidatus Eisenbacteria bacterium]|uniref:Response regulator transcription factor n=1 Tax=Eiseniibacteriota bacterium TaxID=2212470 RepID=A0A956LXM1_UNCEI|nr:response regulator transcription factor [Candidatus Eisenbacteria bacterium]
MRRVLIVEDDPSMAAALRDGFESEGYQVQVASDGAAGLEAATSSGPDLLILDLMLPKLSGLDVCRRLRDDGSRLPIIMLTARSQEIDAVVGLRTGADDYITKPFGFMELIARVEALLRRTAADPTAPLQFGDVTIDLGKREVRKEGRRLDLSPRELHLLEYLVRHRGEVIERETLLDAVWGYQQAPLTRTVDVHVAKLRRKLEDDPTNPRLIVTVHRAGYRFTG